MNHFVAIYLSILIVTTRSAFYETLQKQFKQMKVTSTSETIQSINLDKEDGQNVPLNIQTFFDIKQTVIQTEIKEYEQNYNEYIQSLSHLSSDLQKWKPDPQLSTIFDLTTTQKNETFILKGQQASRLVLDLTATNADPLNTKNDGIFIILINLSTLNDDLEKLSNSQKSHTYQQAILKNIEYKTHLRKHHFVVIPFTSDIYELWVVRQPIDNQKSTVVHFSLQINIEQQPYTYFQSQKVSLTPEQEHEMVQNMKNIVGKNEITFLDSLQLWQKVQDHRKQHQKSFEWNQSVQLFECLGLLLLYVSEYVVLRFITRKKVVI